jgi:hypothetical protein
VQLTNRLPSAVTVVLVVLVLAGCTNETEPTVSGTQPRAAVSSRTPLPPVTTPTATVTRQPADRPPTFTDPLIRALYWKAVPGSCLYYRPPHKDQPVYYDRFPRLELVACNAKQVTHKVVKRHNKFGACAAGQARYRLDHPAMSHKVVMTLCLRSLLPPSPRWPPNIQPKR